MEYMKMQGFYSDRSFVTLMWPVKVNNIPYVNIRFQHSFVFKKNGDLLDSHNKVRKEYFSDIPESSYQLVSDIDNIPADTTVLYCRFNRKTGAVINCMPMSSEKAVEKFKEHCSRNSYQNCTTINNEDSSDIDTAANE